MDKKMLEAIADSEKVLVGIGEDWDGKEDAARAGYESILKMLDGKDYYIVSLCEDGLIDSMGFDMNKVVCPLDNNEEKWNEYNEWIARTLNKKVCILELGVGLKYPSVIRWPFEKIAFFNNKAVMFRVHKSLYQTTEELKDKCIGIEGNPLDYVQ